MGMPKRCVLPQAMSAPNSAGACSSVSASRSAATITRPPRAWIASTSGFNTRTWPVTPGYWNSAAKQSLSAAWSAGPTSTSMPIGCARVRTTSSVCGSTSSATKNTLLLLLPMRSASVIASAAAVASSSIDALAMAMPVRSVTRVWKFSSASMRPCEISAW